ncbi:MAG: hypothetical protein GWM92_05895 [Gemmatimonadetes bacterium]|nr:hypothetical protein [Gemmatimonadota bacterium]NIR78132.1 hypothetical protein [Gemmatimonadota bacterium]NIT86694.1 hypothetical protein [Gemmatimonadota bacterium]NIU30552.1 hypothetical protein [Gemmatimonadota bacterium]NIU35391.1 hypothetical protein [Gemmatimonadota bacterium]
MSSLAAGPGRIRPFGVLAAVALLGLGTPRGLAAQGVRGWARTTARYVQLRPLALDTIPPDQVTVDDGGFALFEGQPVACRRGLYCTRYRMAPVDHVVHGTQDVSFTAWGLGVQGLSGTVFLRGRADVAGDFTWPRSDDPLDAILAYAQLARGPLRVRVGRQEARSGLGFASFDGGNVRWAALDELRLEAYGGRSLARGLREPRDEALQGLQRFVPDQNAYLVGGAVEGEPVPGTAVTARYQREIWADRSALISERASLGFRSATLSPLVADGSAAYDFAFGRVGKAHLSVRYPVSAWSLQMEGTLRRYVPYFELHTIWGFFDPVAYHEAELRSSWWPGSSLGLWASGARRWYEDTHTTDRFGEFAPLEGTAWRASAGARWTPLSGWTLDGQYRLEWANGAFLSSGDLSVTWTPTDRLRLSATGTALQQFEEYRLGESTALGVGGTGRLQLTDLVRLDAGASLYRQVGEGRLFEAEEDWSQVRAWSAVRVEFGRDPGMDR